MSNPTPTSKPQTSTPVTRTLVVNSHHPVSAAIELGARHALCDLANRSGIPYSSLANKLNPNCENRHLTLSEAVLLTEAADDDAILEAWAHRRGKALVDVPEGTTTEEELTDQVLLVQVLMGTVCDEIRKAREDGIITPDERSQIQKQVGRLVREVVNLDSDIGSQVREFPLKGA